MTNFSINFSYPWLLLLLIPAGLLTLIPYFRLNKRYRCTRNRIVSIVLHLIIMVLSISVLAGISFDYDVPNEENEVIILVDTSDSGEKSLSDKDDFIKSVIDNSDSMFKLGIVTFGYDQVYAAELTNKIDSVYASYITAPSPDNSATDIAAALTYAAGLFTNPEAGRIVLISDAVETDGKALNVIKTVAATGVKVDTVHFPDERLEDEVQLVEMVRPEEKIKVGQSFSVQLTVQSSYRGYATVVPYDNDVAGETVEIELTGGTQTVSIPYSFAMPGMHKLSFEISADGDTLATNNTFNSYMYLEIFDKILIIESSIGESSELTKMLRDELKVKVVACNDEENMPKTVNDLRAYDEVILCNVANADMPKGFDKALYSYVRDFGGGLFTVCGNDGDSDTANAYTREDMYGTDYQKLLPVEVINYTPPLAVMILIDRSGSMYDPEGDAPYEESRLFQATQGAEACLDALSERDYVGIMSLSDEFDEQIELTPRPQRDKILAAINKVGGIDGSSAGGGTIFSDALERAGKALLALSAVEKRHIIIVSDGEPSGEDTQRYQYWAEQNAKAGITLSIVGIECGVSAQETMIDLLENHAGMSADNLHVVDNILDIPRVMKADLEQPEIQDYNPEEFTPEIKVSTPITEGIKQDMMPMLGGFYGVKLKEGAEAILMGEYTPIYSQWQCGKGYVGTFACDLDGTWSNDFINSEEGKTIINNIVTALFPTENIRPKNIEIELDGDNYKTQLSIFTDLAEGQTLELIVRSPEAEGTGYTEQVFTKNATDSYSRMTVSVKTSGLHEIIAYKKDAEGAEIEGTRTVVYKPLSYSKEYNLFTDEKAAAELMQKLAQDGNGMEINEPWEIFENAVKYLHRSVDPRIPFIITVLVLFLLDIAARKFKWKWPHEIIRDKKAQAELKR